MTTVTVAAATYDQLSQIAQAPEWQRRVGFAMNSAAAAIYNEGAGVANHSARAAYAIKVASGNYNLQAVALAIITASGITAEAVVGIPGNNVPDTDIAGSVSALWNMLAGV